MTLVEVLGGLALLASLLTGLLLARARYSHQTALADRRLHAIAAADGLLATWHTTPRSLVRNGSGIVAGDDDLAWRTSQIANAGIEQLGGTVVRLDVLDERSDNEPLASVEFVAEPEQTGNAAPPATKPTRPAAKRAAKSRTEGK